MDPLYFPFTFISEVDAKNVAACFGGCTVMMPSGLRIPNRMHAMVEKGWISLAFPYEEADAPLTDTIRHLETWAELHGLDQLRQMARQSNDRPYEDESSKYGIAAHLKRENDPTILNDEATTGENEAIFQSRVFLQMAREFDRQQLAIQSDLNTVASMTNDFHQILHATLAETESAEGSTELAVASSNKAERFYMFEERLNAWAHFLLSKSSPSSSLLVTTYEAMTDLLFTDDHAMEPVLSINHISVSDLNSSASLQWRHELARWLFAFNPSLKAGKDETLPVPPKKMANDPSVSLTIYYAKQSPFHWLRQVAGKRDLNSKADDRQYLEQVTLIAIVRGE